MSVFLNDAARARMIVANRIVITSLLSMIGLSLGFL